MTPYAGHRFSLIALIVVALSIRVAYNFWWIGADDPPVADASDYHDMAVQLLESGVISHPGRPPLFPAALAGVYGVFGAHPFFGRLFLCLIDALTCGVIYLMGREAFGARAGLFAAWAATAYAMLFRWSGFLLTETPFTLLLCLFIYLSLRTIRTLRWQDGLAAGLCLGLATLTRPTTLIFIPFIPVWAWLSLPGKPRQALIISAAIAGMTALTLAPWTIRNYGITGRFVPVTTMGGQVLIGANNPNVLNQFAGGWIPPLKSGLIAETEIAGLSPVERDHLYRQKAIAFITGNPLYVARLCVYKFKLFWHLNRAVDPASLQYLFVAGCALIGAVRSLRQWRRIGMLYLMPLFFTLSALIFWGDDRIRSPIEPALLVFAATTWLWALERWRKA